MRLVVLETSAIATQVTNVYDMEAIEWSGAALSFVALSCEKSLSVFF